MKSIKSILSEIQESVEQEKILSPSQWINWALELNGLWPELKTALTKAEIGYISELAKLMEDKEMSKGKAEILVKSMKPKDGEMTPYELYRYLVGRDKLVGEFIMLAKKRATLEQTF